jgi:hypothetical protein
MSYGFAIYKANGSLMFDLTNRLSRLHTTVSYSIFSNTSQYVTIPGLSTDGTWAVIALRASVVGSFQEVITYITANTLQIFCPPYCNGHSGTVLVYRL